MSVPPHGGRPKVKKIPLQKSLNANLHGYDVEGHHDVPPDNAMTCTLAVSIVQHKTATSPLLLKASRQYAA